jgi:lipid-A-disaccharide synthase
MSARLLVSAGELSGEQHAARLIAALKNLDPTLAIDAYGGDLMRDAGAELLVPLSRHAVMGFAAVFKSIGTFAGILRGFAEHLATRRPDAVVLVDYPGLHLEFARLAKRAGVPVYYYCCPQYWAWAPWRGARFARRVARAFTIFPFEEAYFRDLGVPAQYVGHPSADRLAEETPDAVDHAITARVGAEVLPVALLPGSRPSEVRGILPWMLAVARKIVEREPAATFWLPQFRADTRDQCERILATDGFDRCRIVDRVPAVLRAARCALVASGTATFEVGYFGVPMVVLYKITRLQRFLGSKLLTVPWISQVNLIAGRELVPEVLAVEPPIDEVAALALDRLRETPTRQATLSALQKELAPAFAPGAAARAASAIVAELKSGG